MKTLMAKIADTESNDERLVGEIVQKPYSRRTRFFWDAVR